MTKSDWTFLEPWYAVLRECSAHEKPTDFETGLQFTWPKYGYQQRTIYLKLYDDALNLLNATQLKMIQEATEVFTLLSVVDNQAFAERFPFLNASQLFGQDRSRHYPRWKAYICGTLAFPDVASVQAPVTLARFLGSFEDASPEFKVVMQKLQAMEVEYQSRDFISGYPYVKWTCKFQGAVVFGYLKSNKSETWDGYLTEHQRACATTLPPVVQLCLARDRTELVDIWEQQRLVETRYSQIPERILVKIKDLAHSTDFKDLAEGLAWTPTDHLNIMFDKVIAADDSRQAVVNVGLLMTRLLCGCSFCGDCGNCRCGTGRMKHSELLIDCEGTPTKVFAAICSAVAARSETSSVSFGIHEESLVADLWPWMVYDAYCGASIMPTVNFGYTTLTEAIISCVADALKYRYPLPERTKNQSSCDIQQYGFVDILEGVTVWLSGFNEDEGCALVLPNSHRCRACFKGDGLVEAVIPGYGICTARLGDGVTEIFRDSDDQSSCRLLGGVHSLKLYFTAVEFPSLVVELLSLIGRDIRKLQVGSNTQSETLSLDLSAVSTVCPQLEYLQTLRFDVVVSAHNESLRLWPIQNMWLDENRVLQDLIKCLRSSSLRMAKLLVALYVCEPRDYNFDKSEMVELRTHNGEFLPVTKEKLTIQQATAVISVVTTAGHTKALHRLHPDVLRLLFVFAATPAQRSVRVRSGFTTF